jgi:hypothetical protein
VNQSWRKSEVKKVRMCEASVKACLAVESLIQTQTDEVSKHLEDGRNPTSDVELSERRQVGR